MKVFILMCLVATAVSYPEKSHIRPRVPDFGRVIGGQDAVKNSQTHQVSLQGPRFGAQFSHFCGATIIAPNKIVTAAHCIDGQTFANNRVVAGEHDLSQVDTQTEQIRGWKNAVIHPRYDANNIDFDYGVITLDSDLVFNQYVQPLPLAESDSEASGDCLTSGWGKTEPDNNILPNILQQITLPIVAREDCSNIYSQIDWVITERMVCAGGEIGRSVCNGDSGGPLVCKRSDGRNYLAGITSYTVTPCGETDYPSGWANVAPAKNWILLQ